MIRKPSRSRFLCLLAVALCLLLLRCANAPDLVGKWREIGKTATLEFLEDGSFEAVDNQGMAVSGTYTLGGNESVRFEIVHPGSSSEIVVVRFTVSGDELTIATEHPGEVERYGRLKP